MSTVYVREQGAVVRRQGERLRVTRNNEQLLDLPLLHVDQLVVFGNVQLTSQAVAMLLQKEVDVVFLSLHGKFRGRLVHTGSKFAELRHAQLQKMSRETAALEIARQVVIGKLHNQRFLLETLPAEPPQPPTLKPAGRGIGEMMVKAGSARSVDSLRGYEGRAGAVYWGAFATLLPPALGFQGRKYFPPPDPVNGLLSFGYSLLLKDVSAAVQLVGLDPYLGFFHTIDYGRPSLALDMMEEFRPGLVDAVVLGLARAGDVAVTDFEQTGNPKLPLRMKPAMMDRLINAYEAGVNRKMYHPEAGGETALRRIIELQVRRLARLMLNQAKKYGPFLMKPPAGERRLMFFWRKGPELAVYCDGAVGEQRRATGLGVVIRDGRNEIIGLVKRPMPAMTNNEAEYAALVLALETVQRYRPPALQIFMDSEVVVGQMIGRFAVHSAALRQWHAQACRLARRYQDIRFIHIPRDQNRLADALANEALREAEVRSKE